MMAAGAGRGVPRCLSNDYPASAIAIYEDLGCEAHVGRLEGPIRWTAGFPAEDLALSSGEATRHVLTEDLGEGIELEVVHSHWLKSARENDVWRDRPSPGPRQYNEVEHYDCGPIWERKPCEPIRD